MLKIKKKHQFSKTLNAVDILMVAFGAMIGWGWVVSSGGWIQKAGVIGTVVAFILAGIMIYFLGLVYAELTTTMPKNGGCLLFSYKAFGPKISYICCWAMSLGYIGVVCFEACSLPTVIAYIYPPFLKFYLYTIVGFDVYASWLITAIVISVMITYINVKGIRTAAAMQNILTLIIAIVGLLLIISSLINGDINNLESQIVKGKTIKEQIKNIVSIIMVTPFFLFGFDVIPQATEEINVELKKIGKILILSIILAISFYGLIVFAIGYAMNSYEISSSNFSTGLVAADAIRKMFKSKLVSKILILGGLCGIITSWNSFLIGGSRMLYSMSRFHMIPWIFSKLDNKYKTPSNSIYLIGFLSIIAPFFGKEMLNWIANCASLACCIAYCIVSISYLVIRKKYPDIKRPFYIKKWKMVGGISVIMSACMVIMYLFPNSGCNLSKEEVIIILIWIIVGVIFYIFSKCKIFNLKNK